MKMAGMFASKGMLPAVWCSAKVGVFWVGGFCFYPVAGEKQPDRYLVSGTSPGITTQHAYPYRRKGRSQVPRGFFMQPEMCEQDRRVLVS
jgi:hypothetical protein